MSFADLGVSKPVVHALRDAGVTRPFPIQERVVPSVLDKRDVLVKSPTGSGKTLAFAVPMCDIVRPEHGANSALILAPTRELALQIVTETEPIARAKGLKVAAVYGGAGIQKQAKNARRAHIIVATPGRLEDLINRGDVTLRRVRVAVLDEADRMLDMGFRPVVDRILAQMPDPRQTLFFSATLDGEAGKLADRYTVDPVRVEYKAPQEHKGNVVHHFRKVAHEAKLELLLTELQDADRALVFVRTKRGADRLVKRLKNNGVEAVAMHGNKSQSQREKALARFDMGHTNTLVATDVAARGIDVDDISHVINFDAPEDSDAYIHRVGRTARAGRSGVGITFVLGDQAADVGKIASALRLEKQFNDAGLRMHVSRNGHNGRQHGEDHSRTQRGKAPSKARRGRRASQVR